jgi:hypothetical protein
MNIRIEDKAASKREKSDAHINSSEREQARTEFKVAYIIAVVNEFATRFSLNSQQAYRYLDRFKGIDFVDEFYGVEHTQSFEDVVDDLALYCHKNGGALV